MTPKPRSAEYFDQWYADKHAAPQVAEIMNRHLGLPPDAVAGSVPAAAIDEIAGALRLRPGDVLLDLACGRAFYGLEITARAGARLTRSSSLSGRQPPTANFAVSSCPAAGCC